MKPDLAAIRSDRIAQFTARRETVFGHLEKQYTIALSHIPGWKLVEIKRFLEEWGLPGKQFEFFLDRFQGAALEFEGTLKDQQGTAGTFTGTSSFEAATFGRGLRLDAGEFLDFPTAPASQQPSLIAAEGILVLVVRPSFASSDGLGHRFFEVGPSSGFGSISLRKLSTDSKTIFQVIDSANGVADVEIAATWAANAEVKIVCKWKNTASMEIWVNGVKGVARTSSGTGVMPSLATNLRMGAIAAASEEANGLYDRLMFLTSAFPLNASIVPALTDEYFPGGWVNHFNKGELVDARGVPARPFPMRELYEVTLTVRRGEA